MNIEIKVRVDDIPVLRKKLIDMGAAGTGVDTQTDTYFRVAAGRLKIRRGTIENCIVFYERRDEAGSRRCDYLLRKYPPGDESLSALLDILAASLGILVVVRKRREILYLENIKLHLDRVDGLGDFFEIEAVDTGGISEDRLRKQCDDLLAALGIDGGFIPGSYSDMLLDGLS